MSLVSKLRNCLRQNNILQVSVVGGTLDSKFLDNKKQQDQLELKVAILLQSGDVFLWQEHGQQFYRCIYSLNRSVFVKHMFLNRNELLLVSEFGEGFKGFIRQRKNKKQNQSDKIPRTTEKEALSRLIEKDDCIYVSLEKIPKIYRAFFIQSDFKGTDYCTLQVMFDLLNFNILNLSLRYILTSLQCLLTSVVQT